MAQSIKIKSLSKNISEVEYFLNSLFKELKFSRKVYGKLYLATTEAVNNAILHGNKNNDEKNVTITFIEENEKYKIIVEDEGNGFNYANLPDPRHPDNIGKESGRGIFIMNQYASELFFENNGSSVILTFEKE